MSITGGAGGEGGLNWGSMNEGQREGGGEGWWGMRYKGQDRLCRVEGAVGACGLYGKKAEG